MNFKAVFTFAAIALSWPFNAFATHGSWSEECKSANYKLISETSRPTEGTKFYLSRIGASEREVVRAHRSKSRFSDAIGFSEIEKGAETTESSRDGDFSYATTKYKKTVVIETVPKKVSLKLGIVAHQKIVMDCEYEVALPTNNVF